MSHAPRRVATSAPVPPATRGGAPSRALALVLAAALAACGGPGEAPAVGDAPARAAPTAPSTWPIVTTTVVGSPDLVHLTGPVTLPAIRGAHAVALPGSPSAAARIVTPVAGASFDRAYGADLEAALAALPSSRQEYGLAGLSVQELYGDDGLCEPPHVTFPVDGGYEASVETATLLWLEGAPAPLVGSPTENCLAGLREEWASLPDLPTGCDAEQAYTFFPDGGDCAACLAGDGQGDYPACVDAGACLAEATTQNEVDGRWFAMFRTRALVCAPDHAIDLYLLVPDWRDGDAAPALYDHGAVGGFCLDAWTGGAVGSYCGLGTVMGVGDALPGRIDYLRPEGATTTEQRGRITLTGAVEVEGHTYDHVFLTDGGAVALSAPVGSVPDAWGLNPTELKPGGKDATDPEQTWAREYVAAMALKTATDRAGVLVHFFFDNRCTEDAWEGPFADGSYLCREPGDWSALGADDGMIVWWDRSQGEIYPFPLVTLAGTGLPDPSLPGGLLSEVWSSDTLADPEWEDCSWTHTFTPDRIRLYDHAPGTSDEPYAAFDGQTFRMSRNPEIRLVLATNERRNFCPGTW